MPSWSWSAIGASCIDAYQPGSGTDMELWVAARATSFSGRSHSSRWPLQVPSGGGGVVAAPVPTNVAPTAMTAIAGSSPAASRRRRTRRCGPGSGRATPCSSSR